ncbi:phosphoadenosine phosphosulfate reductase [Candidatus Nasuia deltocephalinicola]|uniref:Phosphoadenosine phosphosulfate reductase n=1 Tax=Candidatus Nasuia deltocephalincola TaxID=1160784 RepID=A0A0S2UPA3_9PROT|nr:phosphoadenosine phosphosulfate reductase [Candidatus Nasuia deltocephalinicola]
MKKNFIDFNPFFFKIINLNYRLEFIFSNFNNFVLSNSLSFEDIFLLKLFYFKKFKIKSFYINTGKVFINIINFLNKLSHYYDISIYYPNFLLINNYINKFGLYSFYNNIILRKICCYIRKIEIYNKVIYNYNLLITGQRSNRKNKKYFLDFDKSRNLIKYNLLYDWDYKDIFYFLEKFNILLNFLYNFNYPSIGCSPCTKKIKKNNYIRKGRWWWEKSKRRECGLHI